MANCFRALGRFLPNGPSFPVWGQGEETGGITGINFVSFEAAEKKCIEFQYKNPEMFYSAAIFTEEDLSLDKELPEAKYYYAEQLYMYYLNNLEAQEIKSRELVIEKHNQLLQANIDQRNEAFKEFVAALNLLFVSDPSGNCWYVVTPQLQIVVNLAEATLWVYEIVQQGSLKSKILLWKISDLSGICLFLTSIKFTTENSNYFVVGSYGKKSFPFPCWQKSLPKRRKETIYFSPLLEAENRAQTLRKNLPEDNPHKLHYKVVKLPFIFLEDKADELFEYADYLHNQQEKINGL